MAYYVPVSRYKEVSCKTLAEAYKMGASVLGSVRDLSSIPGYPRYMGLPIYNAKTGKKATHWVRFTDSRKKFYEQVCESRGKIKVTGGPYRVPKKNQMSWSNLASELLTSGISALFE